jgi:sugar phosphate permease
VNPRIHWAWIILSTSFLTVFIYYSIRLGYSILMPEMILSLKITKGEAGGIASSFFIAYTIFVPLLGYLIDRSNARLLLPLFSVFLAAGTFLMGKTETLFQACFAFFLVGVGGSAMWTPVVTLVQRWFGAPRRGLALGILSVGYAVGYGVMGLALPPLVSGFGWRTCWYILAAFALLLVPLNAILLRNRPRDLQLSPWGEAPGVLSGAPRDESGTGISYGELLRLPSLWSAGISYFFIAFSSYLVNLFIVTYGVMELKFPFPQAAHLASTVAFSGIAGALLLPLLSDFIGRKKTVLIINASLTLSILLIIWAGDRWPALLAAVSIFGIFYASVWPMYAAAAADFFPREVTGTVLGFWTIFYGVSLILAPAAGGYIADLTGTFTRSFLVGVVSGTLATLFFLPVRKCPSPARNPEV